MDENDCMDKPQEKGQKKNAKHDSGTADLEKVTDYAEEHEVLSQDIQGVISSYLVRKIRRSHLIDPLLGHKPD